MSGTQVILIRHAESLPDFSTPEAEWPLSGRGVEQAGLLVDALRSQRIERIYSSPYRRAIDTVKPLSTAIGVPIEICSDLRERRLSHEPISNFIEIIEQSWADFDFALPGCESAGEAQRRALSTINGLAEENSRRQIVISTHGQLLSLFLHHVDPSFGFDRGGRCRTHASFTRNAWVDAGPSRQ